CAALGSCKLPKESAKNDPMASATALHNVVISWTANRETAVNTTGGGYNVYYSTANGFTVPGGTAVNVPYVSGSSAPTSTLVQLIPGTYYVRVAAYSTLNTLSGASTQLTITVPR
ncbi:MAG: hypothetical protein ACXWQO_10370, partial [Bdellovibrionota bacterium]